MPEWVKTHWPKYVEGRESIGAVPHASEWRVAKSIFVADDEQTAQSYGRGEDGPYYAYFKSLSTKLVNGGRSNLFKVDPNMPDSDVTPEFVTNRLVLAGNVNSVVDQLLKFREEVGDFGNLLYACHDWKNIPLAKRSMELMAKEVMPRVNEAIGQTQDNPVVME
jgi:alkanesulfonate monooxygenase SsuD/methylene tetrahydromethanopterin reductase-like flavin-dependent oxidoreductase (luciferase family)